MAKKLINTTVKLGVGTLLPEAVDETKSTVMLLSNQNYTLPLMNFNRVVMHTAKSTGSRLIASTDKIVVGSGVSMVKMSAGLWGVGYEGYVFMQVRINGQVKASTLVAYTGTGGAVIMCPSIGGVIESVSQGDEIELWVEPLSTRTELRGASYINSCYLTVEVIK